MTDPIADMLTRMRNALMVNKKEVVLPYSKIKFNIAQLLVREGWIEKAEKTNEPVGFAQIKLSLKYQNGKPAIIGIKKISKPGCRVYAGKDELPRVLNNLGIAILSTSKGLMTNKEAKKQGMGGEVLCEIY